MPPLRQSKYATGFVLKKGDNMRRLISCSIADKLNFIWEQECWNYINGYRAQTRLEFKEAEAIKEEKEE